MAPIADGLVFLGLDNNRRLLSAKEADAYIAQLQAGLTPDYSPLYEAMERSPKSAPQLGRIADEIVASMVRVARRVVLVSRIAITTPNGGHGAITSAEFADHLHLRWAVTAGQSLLSRTISLGEVRWNWLHCVLCGRHMWDRLKSCGVQEMAPLPILNGARFPFPRPLPIPAMNVFGIQEGSVEAVAGLCGQCARRTCSSCGEIIQTLDDCMQARITNECAVCGRVCASILEPPKLTKNELRRLVERRKAQ